MDTHRPRHRALGSHPLVLRLLPGAAGGGGTVSSVAVTDTCGCESCGVPTEVKVYAMAGSCTNYSRRSLDRDRMGPAASTLLEPWRPPGAMPCC